LNVCPGRVAHQKQKTNPAYPNPSIKGGLRPPQTPSGGVKMDKNLTEVKILKTVIQIKMSFFLKLVAL